MKKNVLLLLAASALLTSGMSARVRGGDHEGSRFSRGGRHMRQDMKRGSERGMRRGFDKKKSILTVEEKEKINPFMEEWKGLCEKRRAERKEFIDKVVEETGIDKKDVNKVLAKYRKRMKKKERLERKLKKYEEPVVVEEEEIEIETTE